MFLNFMTANSANRSGWILREKERQSKQPKQDNAKEENCKKFVEMTDEEKKAECDAIKIFANMLFHKRNDF